MENQSATDTGVLERLIRFLLAFFGFRGPEIIAISMTADEELPIEDVILPDDLLAYVRTDDKAIYVRKGYEEDVAADLGAEVDGDLWRMKEDGADVRRDRKELEVQDFYNQVAMIKWTYLKGFKCEHHPAGFLLNIYRRRSGRFHRSHKTTAPGSWCVHRRTGRCKLAMIEVEGVYWTKPGARGRPKREKHKLGACAG